MKLNLSAITMINHPENSKQIARLLPLAFTGQVVVIAPRRLLSIFWMT